MNDEFHKVWDDLKPSVKKLLAEENEAIRDELTPSELREIGVTQEEPPAPAETFYYDSLPAPEMGGTWESLSPAFYTQATRIWEHLKPEDREKLWSKVALSIRMKILETCGEYVDARGGRHFINSDGEYEHHQAPPQPPMGGEDW